MIFYNQQTFFFDPIWVCSSPTPVWKLKNTRPGRVKTSSLSFTYKKYLGSF